MAFAPAAALAAGIASSFGPCVAPRFIAVCALADGVGLKARLITPAAFIGGLIAGTVVLGSAAALLAGMSRCSTVIYIAFAVLLAAFGMTTIFRDDCGACGRGAASADTRSAGAAFLAGGSMALVVSPCCAPVLVSMAALASSSGVRETAAVLASFAAGHALPLAAAAFGSSAVRTAIESRRIAAPLETVGAGLMLSLSAYYGLLA